MMRRLACLIMCLFSVFGCTESEEDDFFYATGRYQADKIQASPGTISLGQTTRVKVEFTTTRDIHGQYSHVYLYSDQLEYVFDTASVSVDGDFLSFQGDETRTVQPSCIGDSPATGDRYLGFRIDSEIFTDADNYQGELDLSLVALSPITEAFILADARFIVANCANSSLEPQIATSVMIQ